MQLTSSANRGQYLRLMAISSIEILGTIPLGTYYIVTNAKAGVVPWRGWARMHSHSSEVIQVAGFIWRNNPQGSVDIEMFRWEHVGCAFIFFALFGFSGEAREHYHRLFKLLARRMGKSTSALCGTQPACVVRLPNLSAVIHLGSCHSFFLQYYIGPICEGKRWRHKRYHGPKESRKGQLEYLTCRPSFEPVLFYGKHP